MTEEQQKLVAEFIKNHDVRQIRKTITKIFFDYLRQQNAGLPSDFNEVLYNVETLIELIEKLELT